MRILSKHSHWWRKEEKEWAVRDKTGNWWIFKKDKTPTMKTSKKEKGEQGAKFTKEEYVIIGLTAAFAVSFAALIAVLIS